MSDLFNPGLLALMGTFGQTVDVYRSPAASGGMVGTPTLYASSVRTLIGPATDMQRVGLAPQGLGGGRAEYIAIFLSTETNLNLGDELHTGTVSYSVLSPPADWIVGKVAELSRPISATTQGTAIPGAGRVNLDFSDAANSHYIGYV